MRYCIWPGLDFFLLFFSFSAISSISGRARGDCFGMIWVSFGCGPTARLRARGSELCAAKKVTFGAGLKKSDVVVPKADTRHTGQSPGAPPAYVYICVCIKPPSNKRAPRAFSPANLNTRLPMGRKIGIFAHFPTKNIQFIDTFWTMLGQPKEKSSPK